MGSFKYFLMDLERKRDQQTHVKCFVHCPMVNENKKFGYCQYKQWFLKRLPSFNRSFRQSFKQAQPGHRISGTNGFGGWAINFGDLLKIYIYIYIFFLKPWKFFIKNFLQVKYFNNENICNIIVIRMSSCRVGVLGLLDFLRFHHHLFQYFKVRGAKLLQLDWTN